MSKHKKLIFFFHGRKNSVDPAGTWCDIFFCFTVSNFPLLYEFKLMLGEGIFVCGSRCLLEWLELNLISGMVLIAKKDGNGRLM